MQCAKTQQSVYESTQQKQTNKPHYNQIVTFMSSSEEVIFKTWGEVCALTQIVYKHQMQQPSTMLIIISTVLLRQDFMQKFVVINSFYL